MMKKRIILTMLPIMAIAFETLPFGAVLRFATPDKDYIQKFSYFDLTPFGYANFGPFITAVLTVILLILASVNLFKPSGKLVKAITVLSVMALLTSLMPLMFGVAYFSLIGMLISIIIILEIATATLIK